MAVKFFYEIEDIEVGDIAYFKGIEKGAVVVKVDTNDSCVFRLKVETPEEFNPLKLAETSVWLKNSYFRYATRQTLNKPVEKSLPAVRNGHAHVFETQSGARIFYGGSKWSVEPLLSDERLLELLDPSQFPLKDITEEEQKQ